MTQKYVVSHFDQQSGPFDEQELRHKWKSGQLLPIDYVYDEAKNDWVLVIERFGWAITSGTTHPPPLKKQTQTPVKPLEVRGPSVVKEWKRTPSAHGARVKIVNGVGEIDLSPLKPGTVELALQDSTASLLKMNEPLQINVKPADPVRLEWDFPNQQTAGGDLKIAVKALDGLGYVCSDYEAPFKLKIQASDDQEISFKIVNGQATVTLSHTKAEAWKINVTGGSGLQMPKEKVFMWEPGPAARLVLDGPQEYVAGHPLKVQVKAVDAYGNLAKAFQGTVILEIKAS